MRDLYKFAQHCRVVFYQPAQSFGDHRIYLLAKCLAKPWLPSESLLEVRDRMFRSSRNEPEDRISCVVPVALNFSINFSTYTGDNYAYFKSWKKHQRGPWRHLVRKLQAQHKRASVVVLEN